MELEDVARFRNDYPIIRNFLVSLMNIGIIGVNDVGYTDVVRYWENSLDEY